MIQQIKEDFVLEKNEKFKLFDLNIYVVLLLYVIKIQKKSFILKAHINKRYQPKF